MRTVVVALLLLITAAGAAAFDFDKTPGRLPKNVVPLDYTVTFVPNVAARTFTGSERVVLDVRTATNRVVFNTLNMQLRDVRIDGALVQRVTTDNGKQLTTLSLAHPLPAGRHVMTLSYTGKINSSPQGMFAQRYRNASGSGVMISTMLEATDARRLLPCWDEPAFRATFAVTATIPAKWTAVANMPVAHRVVHGTLADVTFERTPKMPTYLIELSAGDLVSLSEEHNGTKHEIWAVRGDIQNGRYALTNSEQILDDFNDYFGFKFPLPHMASIAIPGGFGGAMENWGAITYNERLVLAGPTATLEDRQIVFDVQAHEMAHQWTGDLVTMDWWDNIWLNESFATWMEAKETALRNPTWGWTAAADRETREAMDADGQPTSQAIKTRVTNELEADAAFNPAIVYSKGRAVLRMFEDYLGPDTFREGMRRYIRARAYSSATGSDLWKAMSEASGQDVAAIANGWIDQPGYPVVGVDATCDSSGNRTLTLSQKRFLFGGSGSERWSVPLEIQSANGSTQRVVLTRDGQTVSAGRCGESLTANFNGTGFYRVAYDAQTLAGNTSKFATFTDLDKIAMLNDQWAFARAGSSGLKPYFAFVSQLSSVATVNTQAWEQVIDSLTKLDINARTSPSRAALDRKARTLVQPVYDALGWFPKPDEAPPIATLRRHTLLALGTFGDPAIIATARERFAAFVKNPTTLSPDDQAVVLPIVAQNADAATFARLHQIAQSGRNSTEVRRYYNALVEVRDPQLAQQALDALISDPIPPQARQARLRVVFHAAESHPQLSWAFFQKNVNKLFPGFGDSDRTLFIAGELPDIYRNAAPPEEIGAWIRAHAPRAAEPYIKRAVASAQVKLAEQTRLVAAVNAELAQQ